MTIKKSSGSGIPSGLNAGRPANPGYGQLYSNGETARLELYTQASGWQNIVQETPGVASITGNYSEATNSGTISISGTNFVSGAIASAIGTNGVEVIASSTTYNSLVQLTAVFTGLSNALEPYNIKVTNPSNLFGLLPNALYVNASPVWTTASGSLGTFNEQISISVSATATDSDSTISYALASGSTLPSGVTLNSSTGVISGTLPDIATDTTYNFTINASDGVNTIPRSFSITSAYTIPIEYLVVAGGGGGGGITVGGGGGAGGLLTGTYAIGGGGARTLSLSIGQGGTGSQTNGTDATNGSNSTLSGSGLSLITAVGGGAGGNHTGGGQPGGSRPTGNPGGSGGGGGDTNRSGGSGTSGQGNAGGNSGATWGGGGGGGAGAAGTGGNTSKGGNGGIGVQSSITGITTYYAGGGGGASDGAGGDSALGGGGQGGGNSPSRTPGSGTNGLGGGGGGARDFPSGGQGAPGGSGVIIIAYPNTISAITTIPGTLTYDQPTRSGYRVYRFTAGSGTITV